MLLQCCYLDALSLVRNYKCHRNLTEVRVRRTDHAALTHGSVLLQRALNHRRRELLSATQNELFQAASHEQVAIAVESPQIAGAQPTVDDGRGSLIVHVTQHQGRATDP